MLHQKNNATKYDRYPEIFQRCHIIKGGYHEPMIRGLEPKILSFGCSFGDEIQTLKDKYFEHSVIDGVDINSDCVTHCIERFGDDNKIYRYDEFIESSIKYDVIFAMSVFCKWEDTELIDDCSNIYPFNVFDEGVRILSDKVKDGGLLVIYNANFCMFESSVYNLFRPITYDKKINDSGFVHKFNKNNIKIDIDYKDVIFEKK